MDARDLGITNPADISWVNSRLTGMPILTHREKLSAPLGLAKIKRRAFVLCEQFGFHHFAEIARQQGFDLVKSIGAGHDVQLTHPGRLAWNLIESQRLDI